MATATIKKESVDFLKTLQRIITGLVQQTQDRYIEAHNNIIAFVMLYWPK